MAIIATTPAAAAQADTTTTAAATPMLRQFTLARHGHEISLFLPQDLYFMAEEALHGADPDLGLAAKSEGADAPDAVSELDVYAAYLAVVDTTCRKVAATGVPAPRASAPASPSSSSPTATVFTEISAYDAAPAAPSKASASLPLLRALVVEMHRRYLGDNNVHLAAGDHRPAVLKAYYSAVDTLARYLPAGELRDSVLALVTPPRPALFDRPSSPADAGAEESTVAVSAKGKSPATASAKTPSVFAVFGGQGNTTEYLDELRRAASVYAPLVGDFVDAADAHLAALLKASPADVRSVFPNGLRVRQWLANTNVPDTDYLVSAPVSLPLIGLTQLAWYAVAVKAAGGSFDEARRSWFSAATGHSQGIVPAVAIASADSDASFLEHALQALTLLFHIGTQATLAFPPTSLPPRITRDSADNAEGTPSPMLAVSGALPLKTLRFHVAETNRHLPEDKRIHVALVNGPKNTVVAGPPQSLYGLCLRLRKVRTPAATDESRVPFGKRGLKFTARFLPISAPFHSPYLAPAVDKIRLAVEEAVGTQFAVKFNAAKLAMPVYSTELGKDIRSITDPTDLAVFLAEEICVRPVDWELATAHKPTTHFVDFGPGGASGVGGLLHRNKEGSGIQVISATELTTTVAQGLLGLNALLDARKAKIQYGAHWADEYRPRLVRVGDATHLDTKFTRLVGRPPVMVAGMTPTTVSGEFVSAVFNAGYHIELAGGGHFTEAMLRDKVKSIMAQVEPGNAITINMMFLNPRQWAFQYPLVQALRREGYPVEGVCVAAGVPSPDVASEILTTLASVGIKHVAFKPGSADAILQVVRIAEAHPHVPVILQWTGGRAGGHHSFEDMHAPILEHYAAIRRCPNLVLVAGSGLGGVEDSLPYLTGDWALAFARPAMPFDAVLFGSRMMVAKEAKTSDAVKQLIVACPGVENEADWEQTYVKPTGGILTVRSELGEPIHKVATRGVQLWKELDDTVFNLPKDKRAAKIRESKAYLIDRLNKDAHRPWFGKKADGSVADDLADMTYAEVANRILELTYLPKLQRWIDASYGSLLMDVLLRIEERFTPASASKSGAAAAKVNSILDPLRVKADPTAAVADFLAAFPRAHAQLLTTEDVFFLLTAFASPVRKPAPFIPVLDESLEAWYKKDSLWQSEFVEAVVGEDAQRVCILQGPVATRHANVANLPVKKILDTVRDGHIAAVLDRFYNGDLAAVPRREYLANFALPGRPSTANVLVSVSGPKRIFELPTDAAKLPAAATWLATLVAGNGAPDWLRALVLAQHVVQGRMLADNYVPRLLAPRAGMSVAVTPTELALTLHDARTPGLVIRRGAGDEITMTLTHAYDDHAASLDLVFRYSPETPYALIHEKLDGRNARVKAFYAALWATEVVKGEARKCTSSHVVDRDSIARFCKVVQNDAEQFVDRGQDRLAAPLDYAIVAGWQAVVQPLFSGLIDGDLLKLVHLSNSFKVLVPGSLVYAGDKIETQAEVISMTNTPTGKKITVKGTLARDGTALVEVTSAFFVRGAFDDYHRTFDNVDEEPISLTVRRPQDLAVLEAKEYISFDAASPVPVAVGSTLVFRLKTHVEYQSSTAYASLHTTGTIEMVHMEQTLTVGHVMFACDHPLAVQTSPVVAMLQRLGGVTVEQPCLFEGAGAANGAGYTVHTSKFTAPASNTAYASVSGDYNPIHTNPLLADLAGLPDTITHGMWTSAMTRRVVELHAAENQPSRVLSFAVDFVDMCVPNTELTTTLRHVGMQNGRKIIDVTTAAAADGRVLVKGTAQVAQATSCFVFTGQGSQEVGMGMDLYASSPVAREIWDRADAHFKREFGFSIIEIVRTNPKAKTVHFGGKRGRAIRANYMSMTYDAVGEDGKVTTKSLFPTVTEDTESYTFHAPQGLLYATQFTQPALTLVEKAAFADMEAHGLVPPDCPFAGHSLGEYAALASVADVLPVESLVDIVFYRGMTMQHAVVRAADGSSNYGMCAVNPARVHKFFKEKDLEDLVAHVRGVTGSLLEIVNYNVDGWQYVVAGDLQGLNALTLVLNAVARGVFDQAKLEELVRTADLKNMPLARGHATIPLAGIDVPFHSSFLLPGVAPFREYLQRKIKPAYIHAQRLEARYIPNLTAKPFRVTREYIAAVADQTQSPVLQALLPKLALATPEDKQVVAHTLLIELLAYQFASAVRWIETQDVLFAEYKVERIIEVGPSSTLVGMAERTLKLKYTAYDDALTFRRANLSYARNHQDIYYEFQDEEVAAAAPAAGSSSISSAPATSAPAAAAPVAAAPAAAGGQAEDVPEAPIASTLLLGAIIAQKLKKPLAELPMSKTIKDLVGGKSTMQNEILGDLQKEINTIPERAEETPLDELAAQIPAAGLGKHTTALVSKLIAAKMPGGFTMTMVKDHLKAAYGLGPQRADGLLLLGCTMEPANRLANEDEAKKWLAAVAQAYAQVAGVQYKSADGSSGSGNAAAAPAMSAAQLKALFASQQQLWTSQLNALASALDVDLHASAGIVAQQAATLESLQSQLDLWVAEHGDTYAQGIVPMFEPRKARHFDSAWNWVRQHVLSLFFDIIFGRLRDVDRALIAQCLHVMNRADPAVIEFMEYWLDHHLPFFVDVDDQKYDLVRRLGRELVNNCKEAAGVDPVYKYVEVPTGPSTVLTDAGKIEYAEVQRAGVRKMAAYVEKMHKEGHLHIKSRKACDWSADDDKTATLFRIMHEVAEEGLSLAGKTMLITGCGRDSIGASVLKGALSAGAKVVVTTSSFSQAATQHYRTIFEQHGSRGSALVIVPFNAGSHTDTQKLVQYIYGELGWDLDFIVPFAAISENGREITDIDSKSELAHRLMLTNVLRMLGLVVAEKRARETTTRPAHVLLPLSPNHGTFGGDGLYGESKIALETLLNRWESESWSEYLCVIGAVIGWTRGTGLMSSNNLVSQGIEALGVYTFSTIEMAFNLLCLMHPKIARLSQEEALHADLAGKMNQLPNLKEHVAALRAELLGTAEVRQAVLRDNQIDQQAVDPVKAPLTVTPRANLTFDFPDLPSYKDLHATLGHLQGAVDLDRVVVITGFGEVGPYGNARTRWEMEAAGYLSLEGAIEMAWMMGFIKFLHGNVQGRPYSGWVDAESGAPVQDTEIKAKYEERIIAHTGIRLIEPELFDGYNPEQKTMLQEIVLNEDLAPFEASKEEADRFLAEHGPAKCVVQELASGQWSVTLKKSATLFVPKALRFDRLVAGQIPTGWSARRYGVPDDIVEQVDPITLYVLVSTVEALVSSGITDPYEFYKYVHVTEVGNTSGSGVGGMMANRKIYKDRFLDKPVQNDILQESFINTMAAWVNLLLLSSSGPIKTPVGACATAVESVEIGVETIQSGKAKIVVVGGFDDFQEEGSYEFANMKATSSADAEMAMGRSPREMCRPATSTRGGFMESQGSGIQILMSASVAFEMGVPVYGVIAVSNTATDKQGRSVPAPGQGILTTARQVSTGTSNYVPRSLDIKYRKKQIERRLREVAEWMEEEMDELVHEAAAANVADESERAEFLAVRREAIERDARRQTKSVLNTWGNDFWMRDPTIAPLRGALAVWGLDVNDIGVASFHGTGTKANDFNESQVVHRQLEHLGRAKGNPVPAIFQKYLTGHPKGAAAAWMLNGVLQVLATGIIPGNRNADNIDAKLAQFTNVLYPSVSMQTDGVKAALLKSFGFGQVGGELLVLHPHYVLATLSENAYSDYAAKRAVRQRKAYRYWHDTLSGARDFVDVKHAAPYTAQQEAKVYLDPTARAEWDPKAQAYNFDSLDPRTAAKAAASREQQQWLEHALVANAAEASADTGAAAPRGVGVDIELVAVFADMDAKQSFIERNFTAAEIEYCASRPDPAASFAGRWAAKEAVVKALSSVDAAKVLTQGAGAPLKDIEVLPTASGAPEVRLHGAAEAARVAVGAKNVKVTISHSGDYAAAVCNAL
ncbi:fatty acid synthase alpha subunit Lsd1 [Blastocladiella emersonii ATCC 22665]|nr:fatty acid synthase alpha subunit Lsd1 [Blastocladiella emersonii ATCC 22665]